MLIAVLFTIAKRWSEVKKKSVVSNSLWLHGLYSPWNSPGQNTGMGSLSLLQIFPTQWSNPGLPHCRQILYQLSHQGSPRTRRDLPKFVCTPRGGRWAQGAAAGTKAPVPCGVQSKEGSPLWVSLRNCAACEILFPILSWIRGYVLRCRIETSHLIGPWVLFFFLSPPWVP